MSTPDQDHPDDDRPAGALPGADVMPELLPAAIVAITDRICELSDGGELAELGEELLGGIALLLRRPRQLDVVDEHRAAAVALVTAYLDADPRHGLMLQVLTEHDDRARVDPEWRLATTAALAQLAADVLALAVAALSEDDAIAAADEATTAAACRELLSRLVQVR